MKKIPTIFKRNHENMKEITREHNPACEWVFSGEGLAIRKYDGTCCMVKDGHLYKRREVKPHHHAPADFDEVQYDENTGKRFGWVPVDQDNPEDKYHREAFGNDSYPDGTYELVGPKIQGNPERFTDHWLVSHEDIDYAADIFVCCPRTFDELREWLADKDIEGIVFRHPDGRMAKIKKRDFGLKRKP